MYEKLFSLSLDLKLQDVGLVVTRQAEDVVHYGRNCLNMFQTTVDADPETPSMPKNWEQDGLYKKKSGQPSTMIQNGSFGGKYCSIIKY